MATLPLLDDESAGEEARAIFGDIRTKRGTDYINNFWRHLANDPSLLAAIWERLQVVMAPGALDPLVKEMLYVAVSTANGCDYCIASHTAAAKAKGMSPAQHAELLAVIGMASQTNAIVKAMGVEVDERFRV